MNLLPKIKYSLSELINLQIKSVNKLKLSAKYDVTPFDVTLRDGLQGLTPLAQEYFTTEEKMKLYDYLLCKYNPPNLEIGSCVNNKIFPIFNDIESVFNLCENKTNKKNSYILVPNKDKLVKALQFGATNFSLITSVSNSFQIKNTKMTLKDNFANLNNMISYLKINNYNNNNSFTYKIKIYVSCINQCPFEGKLHTDYIVSELYTLSMLNIDKICLSDTCGTLTNTDFIDIVDNIKKLGLDTKQFSLHLHINPNREEEAEKIFHTALDYGINEFDVSELRTGGCSITINKNELAPNMSYEQYFKFLISYENKNNNF